MDFTDIFMKIKWGKHFHDIFAIIQEGFSWRLYLGMVRVSFEGCVLHAEGDGEDASQLETLHPLQARKAGLYRAGLASRPFQAFMTTVDNI
jgi:hypothetical protein